MPRPAERRPRLSAGETASPRGEAFFDEFEASAGVLQSAAKARKRKNCPDKREVRGNFCFRRQLHLQPAVTYVHVSSLVCKFAPLSCRLSHRSVRMLTLSTS